MAQGAQVRKIQLGIADLNRHHYQDYSLTMAQHPSETEERLMMRLLAFSLHADENLTFTRGLCADDEPDIWQKGLTGDIDLWLEVGQPSEERIRKACHKAKEVVIYAYGDQVAPIWWDKLHHKVSRFGNLKVRFIEQSDALLSLFDRHMKLNVTVEESSVMLGNEGTSLTLELQSWQG